MNYMALQSFDYERIWWFYFLKRLIFTKLNVDVIISLVYFIIRCFIVTRRQVLRIQQDMATAHSHLISHMNSLLYYSCHCIELICRMSWTFSVHFLYSSLLLLIQLQTAHQNIKGCLPELEISKVLIYQRGCFFLRLQLSTLMSSWSFRERLVGI